MRVNKSLIPPITYIGLIFFLSILYYIRNRGYSVDDSFITYRYAYHLKEGFGLNFNINESYYGTTAAGFAFVIGILGWFADKIIGKNIISIQEISVLLSTISIAFISLSIPFLLDVKRNLSKWIVCIIFSFIIFCSYPFNEVAGHETYTFIATSLIAIYLLYKHYYFLSGIVLAIAVTFRPDSIIFFPIFLLTEYLRSGLTIKNFISSKRIHLFLFGALLISVPWFIFLKVHFNAFIPGTMDAKKAQILLGYWPHYNLKNLFNYVFNSINSGIIYVVILGFFTTLFSVNVNFNLQLIRLNLSQKYFFTILIWTIFIFLSTTLYLIFNVTFWSWYAIPLVFYILLFTTISWGVLFDNFYQISEVISENKKLKLYILFMPILILSLIMGTNYPIIINWINNKNINEHTNAYNEIVTYLHEKEPNGTVIQMFEPGSFGFKLGPKYIIIDELGLVTPGVARALLSGDNDYPSKTFDAKYLVCSWKASYSQCEKSDLLLKFRFVGEFNKNFWNPLIGSGAKLYVKDSTEKPLNIDKYKISNMLLGDIWGKVDRILNTNEWFIHPGAKSETSFTIDCDSNCSGQYWAHIANLPKEAPQSAGDIIIKFIDSENNVVLEKNITRSNPMIGHKISTLSSSLRVVINNNGAPDYDWLVFGFSLN
jgi:arabinofuranosyltransferase